MNNFWLKITATARTGANTQQSPLRVSALLLAVGCFLSFGVAVTPAKASLIGVTVDAIVYPTATTNLGNYQLGVQMMYAFQSGTTGKLTIQITNSATSSAAGSLNDAGNLITGLGFSLPGGVTILDSVTWDSTIVPTSPDSRVRDKDGNVLASQDINDDWGWRQDVSDGGGVGGGHFALSGSPGSTLPVNTLISTQSADLNKVGTKQLFDGSADVSNSAIDSVDFGLGVFTVAEGNNKDYVDNSVFVTLFLSGVDSEQNILQLIDEGNVVLSYGSPTEFGFAEDGFVDVNAIPEPTTTAIWVGMSLLFGMCRVVTNSRRRNGKTR